MSLRILSSWGLAFLPCLSAALKERGITLALASAFNNGKDDAAANLADIGDILSNRDAIEASCRDQEIVTSDSNYDRHAFVVALIRRCLTSPDLHVPNAGLSGHVQILSNGQSDCGLAELGTAFAPAHLASRARARPGGARVDSGRRCQQFGRRLIRDFEAARGRRRRLSAAFPGPKQRRATLHRAVRSPKAWSKVDQECSFDELTH
ncbi:exported hypothetical protein [Bradyrhizobium sp. STM 3843]|nr:exported hypothetical protein [Bradyrhizobium sp. STM 3843]